MADSDDGQVPLATGCRYIRWLLFLASLISFGAWIASAYFIFKQSQWVTLYENQVEVLDPIRSFYDRTQHTSVHKLLYPLLAFTASTVAFLFFVHRLHWTEYAQQP